MLLIVVSIRTGSPLLGSARCPSLWSRHNAQSYIFFRSFARRWPRGVGGGGGSSRDPKGLSSPAAAPLVASHTRRWKLLFPVDTLFFAALMPGRHLLSVMRQKVSKERSQEGCAPLANPHHFLAYPLRKFGPSPTPLRLCKTPVGVPSGTAEAGNAKHRETARPKLGQDLPTTAAATPHGRPVPLGTRTGTAAKKASCRPKTAIADRAPLRRPPRRAQLRCCSAGYGAFSEKEPRPTVTVRALGLFWSPAGISSRLCSRTTSEIPLKAGGRPVPLGTRTEPIGREKRSLSARLGDSFYFAQCEIVNRS